MVTTTIGIGTSVAGPRPLAADKETRLAAISDNPFLSGRECPEENSLYEPLFLTKWLVFSTSCDALCHSEVDIDGVISVRSFDPSATAFQLRALGLR